MLGRASLRRRSVPVAACCALAAFFSASASASAATPYKWLRTTGMPLIMAHQGGEDENPSNTMYAFKHSFATGANSLELDVGVTKDNVVVIRHDTTVDSTTNGAGNVSDFTLAQIKQLDAAYWFAPNKSSHYGHQYKPADYPFRGIATGAKAPPTGFTKNDFKVATLAEVMAAFPHTPINVEIKGRTPGEDISEYLTNARVLANFLKTSPRTDIVVVSFKQAAVDLFNQLAPNIPSAPGVEGDVNFFWSHSKYAHSMSKQTVAFQVPVTYRIGSSHLLVAQCGFLRYARNAGYAWHSWFSDDDIDGPVNWKLLMDLHADGIMTSHPHQLSELMKTYHPANTCRF